MQFDPTIRLDFVATALGVIFFLARMQSRMERLSEDNVRTSSILEKLERRLRRWELRMAAHVGAHAGVLDDAMEEDDTDA